MTLLPEVLGEPVVCPPNKLLSQSGIKKNGEMPERMVECRDGKKMLSISSTQESISLLEESTQPTENLVQMLLTCNRQVLSHPQWHTEDGITLTRRV